jgi:hypothetical protein
MRLWWALDLIAFAGLEGYLVWYWRRRYPGEVARLAREEERRRWAPKPKQRRASRRR